MARRNDNSREEIREMALQAAEAILVEQGIQQLSARQVAKRIGYAVGTLYLVFKNLDDLMLQINARTLKKLHQHLQASLKPRSKPNKQIHQMAQAYLEFARLYPQLWALLYDRRSNPELELPASYSHEIQATFDLLEDLLAKRSGQADKKKCHLSARVLWGAVHGITVLALDNKLDIAGDYETNSLLENLVEHYLAGF